VSLNPAMVGRALPSFDPYEVSLAKVREFALALGDRSPVYHDPEAARRAGYPHVIAPPTFAIVVSHAERMALLRHEELGLRFERMLHAEQRFRYERPIAVGDVLTTTCVATAIEIKGQNELLRFESSIVDAAGALVCTVEASVISRGTAP
jgi:acyl dehydratase